MEYSQTAIISDLDGTLLDSMGSLSAENRKAIDDFIAGGGLFGISTGRSPSNVAAMLPEGCVNTWSVVLDGAETYQFGTRTVAFPKTLTRIRMAVFLEAVLNLLPEVDVLVYTESRQFLISDRVNADPAFCRSHRPVEYASLGEALSMPWMKVSFRASRSVLDTLENGASRRGIFEICRKVWVAEDCLDFVPISADKGRCLKKLRSMPCFKNRKIITIGNSIGDLPLLSEADIPAAVENALPEVKDRASILTPSCDENAIAHLIRDILPQI